MDTLRTLIGFACGMRATPDAGALRANAQPGSKHPHTISPKDTPTDLQPNNRKAIVTGGSAGIGLALLAEGVSVVVPGRTLAKLDRVLPGNDACVQKVVADLNHESKGLETF